MCRGTMKWADSWVIQTLKEQAVDADVRKAMRQARQGSGLKWDRFAHEAGFSRSHLRAVENGTRAVTADVARAYDRVLGTGAAFSEMVDGPQAAPWNRQGTLEVLSDQARGCGVDRRSFVITSGAALAALLGHWRTTVTGQSEPSAATAAVLRGGPPFGTSALFDHIGDRLEHLRHLDDELGSGQMARLARNELVLLTQLINAGGLPEHAEARALSLAAEAARQTAWSLFDSDRHAAAERYFETALRASATAVDVTAGAYAMSFQAVQHYTVGDPRDAVNLLTFAEESVAGRSTPRMRAMLAARKARALSKTGDRHAVTRALHHARELLERGPHDDDPPVLYWVTLAEIEMIAGSSALELHDPAAALHFFTAAADADYPGDQQFPRSHAIYLARAAEAHLALHDLDAAVTCARHAARCLSAVDSARSDSALSGLRRKLAPHSASRTVRDFLQGG